jgi:putative nucleotidyltransferase with HDIG domain
MTTPRTHIAAEAVVTSAPPGVPPLPPGVTRLLDQENAPPRLIAHLALVHAAAGRLVASLLGAWPNLAFDPDVALLGAAVHDIGKTRVPAELEAPGDEHEAVGVELLTARGYPAEVAEIARLHGHPDLLQPIESLIAAVADSAWKGGRWRTAEDCLVDAIARLTGEPPWEVFSKLDDAIEAAATDADVWTAWHAAQATRP